MPSVAPEDLASFDLVFVVANKDEFELITTAAFSAKALDGQHELELDFADLESGALAFESPAYRCMVTCMAEGGDPARALLSLARFKPGLIVVLGVGQSLRDELRPGDVVVGDLALGFTEREGPLEERWRLALEAGSVREFVRTSAYDDWRTRPSDAPKRRLFEGWVAATPPACAEAVGEWFEARGNTFGKVSSPLVRALAMLEADTRVAVVLAATGDGAFAGAWALAETWIRESCWWRRPASVVAVAIDEPNQTKPAEQAQVEQPQQQTEPPRPKPAMGWVKWAIQAVASVGIALIFFWFGTWKSETLGDVVTEATDVNVESGINVCLAIAKRGYVGTGSLAGVDWNDKAGVLQRIHEETKIDVAEPDAKVVVEMARICTEIYAPKNQRLAQVSLQPSFEGARVRLRDTGDSCLIEDGHCQLRVLSSLDDRDVVELWAEIEGRFVGEPRTIDVASLVARGVVLNVGEPCRLDIRDDDDKAMVGQQFERIMVSIGDSGRLVSLDDLQFVCTEDELGKDARIDATLNDQSVRSWSRAIERNIKFRLDEGEQQCRIKFLDRDGNYATTVTSSEVVIGRTRRAAQVVKGGEFVITCPQDTGAAVQIYYDLDGRSRGPVDRSFDSPIITVEVEVEVELGSAGGGTKRLPPCDQRVKAALVRSTCRIGSKLEIRDGVVRYEGGDLLGIPRLSGNPSCRTECPL